MSGLLVVRKFGFKLTNPWLFYFFFFLSLLLYPCLLISSFHLINFFSSLMLLSSFVFCPVLFFFVLFISASSSVVESVVLFLSFHCEMLQLWWGALITDFRYVNWTGNQKLFSPQCQLGQTCFIFFLELIVAQHTQYCSLKKQSSCLFFCVSLNEVKFWHKTYESFSLVV